MTENVATSHPRNRPFQRLIARAARLLARGVYRSVEVENDEPGWSDHPVILVANHPTGFSDPALLLGLLERSPRFLAKSTLWKTRGLGWFLDRIGAIPVYRSGDGSTARNDEMFGEAFEALREGATVALFPEGKAIDSPSIAPLRTGAARIALGARAAGVKYLQIVPVGIHFEDKAAIRSRAYVRVGDVLDLDTEIHGLAEDPDATSENWETVRRLTDEIEERLRASAPNHASHEIARELSFASAVTLRDSRATYVPFADRQSIAAALGTCDSEVQASIMAKAARYRTTLEEGGVTDADIVRTRTGSRLRSRLVGVLASLVVLAPFAAVGILLNLLPYIALRGAMRVRHDEMTPSTVRLLAAAVAFLAMWVVWTVIAWSLWDWRMALIALVAGPLYGAAAVFVLDRTFRWWRDYSGLRRASRLVGRSGNVVAQRELVVSSVEEALGS
jgi:glycerol-3-phosphate O-acyltransferase/dihydroxyacetone phosphate acyltransferase